MSSILVNDVAIAIVVQHLARVKNERTTSRDGSLDDTMRDIHEILANHILFVNACTENLHPVLSSFRPLTECSSPEVLSER